MITLDEKALGSRAFGLVLGASVLESNWLVIGVFTSSETESYRQQLLITMVRSASSSTALRVYLTGPIESPPLLPFSVSDTNSSV